MVQLVDVKTEKYGRLLAKVMHNNESCGAMLIDLRLAVPYDGGAKSHLMIGSSIMKMTPDDAFRQESCTVVHQQPNSSSISGYAKIVHKIII